MYREVNRGVIKSIIKGTGKVLMIITSATYQIVRVVIQETKENKRKW